MAFDTKPNLSNDKFEQLSGETLTLNGVTEIHGILESENGGVIQINSGGTFNLNSTGTFNLNEGSSIDAGIITGGTTLLSADIGASTDEPIIRFKNKSTNNVASGFVDINIGTCNINASTDAWGSIAIGQSNLVGLNATGDFAGGRNIGIGFSVGCDITTGSNNVLLGRNVFQSSTTGSYNVMAGYGAGQNMTVNGKSNVGLGLFAMRTITSGTGNYNTAIGTWAASEPASLGNYNTTIGNQSMQCAGTVACWNTAIGSHAFQKATLGHSNAAIGTSAGRFADGTVGGAMVGWQAGFSFGGSYNIALGAGAGCASNAIPTGTGATGGTILTGLRNVFIGFKPTWSIGTPTISDTFVIGNSYEATESNKIYLASKGDIALIASHTGSSSGLTTMTSSGLYYDADYSATGTTDPRWIPDYATVTGLTSGGTTNPAGSDTQIQFNNGGSFGANSYFSIDNVRSSITLGLRTAGIEGFNSVSIGYNNAIGNSSIAVGSYNSSSGNQSNASGKCVISKGINSSGTGYNTYAKGDESHTGGFGNATKNIYAYGLSSFNHSINTSDQIVGHGALAQSSIILGGRNHNIEVNNANAAIIGGNTIKLTGSSYINTTAVGNLAIMTPPSAGGSNDVLTWETGGTGRGIIRKVTQASISDGRLKTDLVELEGVLPLVNTLKAYKYKFNAKMQPESMIGQERYGLIAQEVEEKFPLVVSNNLHFDDETYKTVEYRELVPVLVQAINELTEKVNELELLVK